MIRIDNLRMSYRSAHENVVAARGVTLDIKQGQFYTLLGPSGCGKTTTLRCVAGLEEPDEGEIVVGDELVFSSTRNAWVPPFKRNIGMVFQSYAIWPHMSVFENVAFPLVNGDSKLPKAEVRERVLRALTLVQLEPYVDRPAPYLSGGQQQRLALARALVGEPRVLLLDEPLSNLDAKLREEMRVELRELVKRLNVTTLFVTHEQLEALTMSDVVAVMKDGNIVQAGTPEEIYARPRNVFVAQFIGRTNLIAGRTKGRAGQGTEVVVETSLGDIRAKAVDQLEGQESVMIAVRPEDVEIVNGHDRAGSGNIFDGHIERRLYLGECIDCFARVRDQAIQLKQHPSKAPHSGGTVQMHLPPSSCLALKEDTV
jgi:iron(III) transport system ATP-binding protein